MESINHGIDDDVSSLILSGNYVEHCSLLLSEGDNLDGDRDKSTLQGSVSRYWDDLGIGNDDMSSFQLYIAR